MTFQKKMTTVKLRKNTSFPTYQLYGQVENKELSPEDRLKILVLETVKWLKSRFENIDMPKKLDLVGPEDYKSFDLDIFRDGLHIEEGYSLDIIYIEDEGIWAMELVEPDLALGIGQNREGVPGRKFSTNIAFKISDNEVECGFKTICIEPEDTDEKCEVFRIAVVKEIVRNSKLGLKQVYPLREEAFKIKNFEELRNFLSFVENNQRQIPIVLLAEYREKGFEDISKEYFKEKLNFTGVNTTFSFELKDKEFKKNFRKDKTLKSKLPLDLGNKIRRNPKKKHQKQLFSSPF